MPHPVEQSIVAVTTIGAKNADGQQGVSSGIGTVIECHKENILLILTCKHIFHLPSGTVKEILVEYYDEQKGKVECFDVVGDRMEDPDTESDICFLLVRASNCSHLQPVELLPENNEVCGQTLYNAQITRDLDAGEFCLLIQKNEKVREFKDWTHYKYSLLGVYCFGPSNVFEEVEEDGWKRCRQLSTKGSPGFSGSLVWDDENRIYGMHILGAVFEDKTTNIPPQELYLARKRVEHTIKEQIERA